jgi:hypothetical protein
MMIALPVFIFKGSLPCRRIKTARRQRPDAVFASAFYFLWPAFLFWAVIFWDKFRALFIYEAKAQIPKRKSS